MGVIDLDARVKALEAKAGSAVDPADFAQVESDVSDLKEAAIPVVTPLTLKTGFTDDTSAGGTYYALIGNLVYVHFAASGLTADSGNVITTIPEAMRPSGTVALVASDSGLLGIGYGIISPSSGNVTITTKGTDVRACCVYPINEVFPT